MPPDPAPGAVAQRVPALPRGMCIFATAARFFRISLMPSRASGEDCAWAPHRARACWSMPVRVRRDAPQAAARDGPARAARRSLACTLL